MLPNILYFKHFNKKNANLVIVLSKLAELNTITLPFEISKILKNFKNVENQIQSVSDFFENVGIDFRVV